MLYEVMTDIVLLRGLRGGRDPIPLAARVPVAVEVAVRELAALVITSYSIHYRKLYDPPSTVSTCPVI